MTDPGKVLCVGFEKVARILTGTLLAEFNPPLIEWVDPPDNTLDIDLVLVHRKQHTQLIGAKATKQDNARWAIARMNFLSHQRFIGCVAELPPDGLCGLTMRQRFGLRQHIR